MGASHSAHTSSDEQEKEDEEEDNHHEDERNVVVNDTTQLGLENLTKKVLEQEPEMLPLHASASPLTPQLSSSTPPPPLKLWDPNYNLLPPSSFDPLDDHLRGATGVTEVYLVSHGECHMNLRPDLVGGRCSEATLTTNGKRQSRALAAFFKSKQIHFTAVYTSPLDRARATALSVCQEMNLSEDQIQSSEALVEMSQGHWEGCHRSEIFTPETITLMERFQPDFCAPSGESLRQVEFRMVQFLNGTVMSLPDKFSSHFPPADHKETGQGLSHTSPHALSNSMHDREGQSFYRHRKGISRKKSGKSRLQMVATTTGGQEADDEMSPRKAINHHASSLPENNVNVKSIIPCSCIGVFTHSVPIKCAITGLLGCSAVMSQKICVEDSSVTVLQHSFKTGWQIKRLNDTAHLRLL